MADETVATWANFLRDAKGPLTEAIRRKKVFLGELRRDKNQRRWTGRQVKVPVVTAPIQGGGTVSETATVNVPHVQDSAAMLIDAGIVVFPVSFSTKLAKQSKGDENSWAEVMPTKMRMTQNGIADLVNEMFLGSSDALIAAFTAGATSATQTVGTGANFYALYPGRWVDVRTRATGALIGARKIIDINETAGTVTFDSSIVVSTAEGIYIEGSYGTALNGMQSILAQTGTVQGIDKGTNYWARGTDVSPGSAQDPTLAIFDKAERTAARNSGEPPDFYLADPAVIDKFVQGITVQARWSGDTGQLKTGFTGIRYRDKLIVPDFQMPPGTVYGINMEDLAIYALDDGPDWDDETGTMFQRFSRSLPVEAWLTWMLQLAAHRMNSQVRIANMNRAA